MGALLVAYLAIPLGAFAFRVARSSDRGFDDAGLWGALDISVKGATISLLLVTLTGVPLAYALARHPGRLSSVVGIVVQIPLALPPLMSGILLLFVVGPYSTIGQFFNGRLTGSLAGVVLAQSFVAAPFLVIAARSAFATVDPALRDVAATLGHRPLARFFRVDLRCAAPGIRAGMVLMWLRAFGEYGATLLIAYHPFTLPIYTQNQFTSGQLSTTEAPTLLALAVAVGAVLGGQFRLPRRLRRHQPLPPASPPPVRIPVPMEFAVASTHGSFHLRVGHSGTATRIAILGASGSGKSLTLRAIAGLGDRDTARVTCGGADVSRLAPERRGIGYVPQGFGLIPGLDVRSQILFGVNADEARAAWWIATLQLGHLLDRYPDELSGGQRQRVSLARALVGEPAVLLLDEPFSALDAPVREQLRRELRRLQQQAGLSTVLVTHDPREAALLAEEVIVIADGLVLQAGTIADVYRRPISGVVGELVGIANLCDGIAGDAATIRCGALTLTIGEQFTPGEPVLWSVAPDCVLVVGSVHANGMNAHTDVDPNIVEAKAANSRDANGIDTNVVDAYVADANVDHADRFARRTSSDAIVRDIIDLGSSVEILLDLVDGPQLRSQGRNDRNLIVGQLCRVHLDAAAVIAWKPGRPAAINIERMPPVL